MYKYFVILSIFLLSQDAFCQENTTNKNKSVEFEALKQPADSNLFLSYYWHDASRGYPVYINPKGSEFLLTEPTFMLEASSRQIPYLIYPGEKLQVIDTGRFLNFRIKDNDFRSHELQFFPILVMQTGNIYMSTFEPAVYYTRKVESLNAIKNSENVINNVRLKRLHILDSMKVNGHLSDSFSAIAAVVIRCKAFSDTLQLYNANKSLLTKSGQFDKMINKKIQSFNEIPFIPFQFYFRSCQNIIMATTKGNPNSRIQNLADFEMAFAFAKNQLSGTAKDFALYTTMNMALDQMLAVELKYFNTFYNKCGNEQYKSLIKEKLDKQKNGVDVMGKDMLLPFLGDRAQSIQDVIKENQGKIIILDFWASWCAPCRAEMPYSKKLLSQYSEEEVVNIYISVDENEADWKKANEELKLGDKLNFRFAGSNVDFINQYKIMGVPRYMIVNKDGKIINEDSPRPSDPKLKEMLDSLLKKG